MSIEATPEIGDADGQRSVAGSLPFFFLVLGIVAAVFAFAIGRLRATGAPPAPVSRGVEPPPPIVGAGDDPPIVGSADDRRTPPSLAPFFLALVIVLAVLVFSLLSVPAASTAAVSRMGASHTAMYAHHVGVLPGVVRVPVAPLRRPSSGPREVRVQMWRAARARLAAASLAERLAVAAARSAPGSVFLIRQRLSDVSREMSKWAATPHRGAARLLRPPAGSLSIEGRSALSPAQVAGWYAAQGDHNNTGVPLAALVRAYFVAGRLTGVRPDVAFAQSMVETGGFSVVVGNNFAGIGNCDSCRGGFVFANYRSGVHAQLALLAFYAGERYGAPGKYAEHSVDGVRVGGYIAGRATTWIQLSRSWSSGPVYGAHVLRVYESMLAWSLAHPQRP